VRAFEAFMIALLVSFLVSAAIQSCGPSDTPTPQPTAQDTVRALPIVYWWEKPVEPNAVLGVYPDSVYVLTGDLANNITMELSNGTQIEWWRIEWRAAPDSCWTYLSGHAVPKTADRSHLPTSGLVTVKIYGLMSTDDLMFWRSHPWPDSIPDGCFKHWR